MGQVVGGEADAGSADNNAVIIKGGIINGAASGSGPKGMSVIGANTNVSGSGGANTNNSVTISGGTFGETAVAAGNRIIGAYSQSSDENISGNRVKISGGTFGQEQGSANFVYGAYDLGHGSTISKNSVAISGGTLDAQGGYDILIGAYIDVDGTSDTASENSVSLTGGSIGASGSADTLQIKGAQINENGTASGNSVEINGADIGSTSAQGIEVEGGIVKTGAASENKVTISSGTLNTSSAAALQLFGGFVQSSGDVTGNDINVTGGTIGKDSGAPYLYGGYTASGNAAENKVEVSGAALNPNAVFVGAFTGSGDASGNTVSLTGQTGGYASAGQAASGSVSGNTAALDGSTATLVYNGRIQTAGTSSGNKVTLSNNSAAGAAYGGYSPSGDVSENTVDVESGSFANNAIGGWTNSGNATGNKSIVNDSKIGSDTSTAYVFGGYSASGEASGSKVTVTNSMLGSKTEVYGGYGTTGSSGSSVTFTGSTGGSLITGGYTGSGSASKNTLGVQDSTVNGSITGGQTGTGDAASNTVNMSGTNTTGSVYGGHVTTSGNATGNTVNFTEGSSNTSLIYGGYTSKGMAKDNHVNISGTSLNKLKLIYGGYSNAAGTGEDAGAALNNTVSITDSEEADGSIALVNYTYPRIYGGFSKAGDASGNEVLFDMEDGNVYQIFGGSTQSASASANSNTVTIKSGTITGLVFAGRNTAGGQANDNHLYVQGGSLEVNSHIVSGYGTTAGNNTLEISGGSLGSTKANYTLNIAAGESYKPGGVTEGNQLSITGGKIGMGENAKIHIFGGYNHRDYANKLAASASDNHISMENGTIDSHGGSVSMIAGDMENSGSGSSTMTNNTITISGGSINAAEDGSTGGDINIAGAYSDSSGASSNEVNISRGTIGTASGVISISGAAAYPGDASGNSVTITGGTIGSTDGVDPENPSSIVGALSVPGKATDNHVSISGANLIGAIEIYGGESGAGSTGNSVTLAGDASGNIYGGLTMGSGAASGNTINLESGHISSSQIIAGYTVSGEASDNTVNITGGVLNGTAALYGGYGTSSTGNTLNVYSKGNTVGELGYFQKIYIAPEAELTIGSADAEGAENTGSFAVENGTTVDAEGALTIAGDLSSDALTVTAGNAAIGGTVSSTNGSTVSLGGNDLALTTANVDNTSTLTLTSGKLTAEKLSDSITGGGKLTLDGTATLATTAGQVFTDGDTTETTAGDNGLTETTADSVNFKAGTLSLSDDYSYTYLTNIQKTMDALEDSKTSIVMTGNLVDTTGISNTLTTEGSNISIGAPSSEDNTTSLDRGFNVAALDMGGADTVSVAGGQNLTLGDSETTDVITTDSGTASVNLAEGSTFTIGNSAVAENQTLNVAADVTAENSTIAANGQTTVTGDVALTDSALTSQTGTLTLEQNLTTSGTSVVTGDVTVAKAITGDSSIILKLGNEEESVNLSARSINLNGGTLYLDPVWIGGTQEDGAEAAAGSITGSKVVIGNNSTLTVGSTDKTLAEKAFTDSGLTWSDTDILSALYVATSASLSDGRVVIDSSANADSAAAIGTFKMGKNSLLMIDGNKVSGSQAAAITDVSTTDISPSAKIYISNAKGNTTYNILSGTNDKDGNGLFAEARAAVNSNVFSYGHLLEFVGAEGNGETQFSVTAESQDAHDVYGDKVIAPNTINAAMDSGGAASAFALAASDDNLTEEAQESAFNSASALTELAGVQHGLYAANNLFDSSLTSHLTGLYTEDQDKDLWAHFIHSKENVRGLGLANMGASYDAQFNGVVVGSDFYKKGNATVGAALTYMDGSFSGNTEAAHTKNDVDYYGLALYGRVEQGPMTYLGDISYLHGSNDLKQHNSGSTITGSTDSDAYSIGVRAERGIGLGMGTLTPFAGLRYAHLGTDAYTDSIGVRHDSDDANVWMFPLGLRYSADIKNGIWTIRPMAEAGYVWTFGDRDGTDKVSLGGASDAFGFDIADAGSWYGRLGVQAAKGNFTYGVACQYQHGTSVQSNTWTAAVRYHF